MFATYDSGEARRGVLLPGLLADLTAASLRLRQLSAALAAPVCGVLAAPRREAGLPRGMNIGKVP
eukprot:gene7401-1954_t